MINYFICLNSLFLFFFPLNFNFVVEGDISSCDAKLQWSINAQGFHREIKYNLKISTNNSWSECKLLAKQIIPRSLYVNKDQLEDLRRLKKVTAIVNDFIDTEMAEDVSVPHDVYLFADLNQAEDILTSDVYLPIHVRYHSPQPGGGFQSAILTPPEIYINCSHFLTDNSTAIIFPCTLDSVELCAFDWLPYEIEVNTLEVLVPVGNSDHYNTVTLMTYFVTIAGTFYVYTVILLNLPKSKKN